jgi:hypothetical protein
MLRETVLGVPPFGHQHHQHTVVLINAGLVDVESGRKLAGHLCGSCFHGRKKEAAVILPTST